MFIKRLLHFITGRSLDKHRIETEAKIKELERKSRELQSRLEFEAKRYEHQIDDLVARREASLKKLAELLDRHALDTTAYASSLAELQALMLACVEAWSAKSLVESHMNLKGERIQGLKSELALLREMDADLRRLCQHEERKEWQSLFEGRPSRVDSAQIREFERRAEKEVANDNMDVKTELRRLRGHRRSVSRHLRDLHAERATLRETDFPAARERLSECREAVRGKFADCRSAWSALQEALEALHSNFTPKSQLAQQWVREADDGKTFRGLQKILSEARERSDVLKVSKDELNVQMTDLKSRIDIVHKEKRFEALEELKARRAEVYKEIGRIGTERFQVRDAMRELRAHRDKLQDLRSLMEPLRPERTVEQVFERVGKDDPDLYWRSIGLSTRALPRPVKEPTKERA